jgi:type IV pilus assembly protein PilM
MALRKRVLLPIGIHLNPESVHMVQVEQTEASLALVSKASVVFPPLEGETGGDDGPWTGAKKTSPEVKEKRYRQARDFVRERCSADGFRGKQAVISIPAEHLVIQQVRMAPMQPEELIGALPWELQGKLPFDPKQAVVRHIVAGTVSEDNQTKQDVIALAVPREVVEKHILSVEKLGLEVVGVGVEPCAMCYPYVFAASHTEASQAGPSSLMLVHIGALATYVAIARGEETRFVKGVTLGVASVVQAVAEARKTGLEQARALVSTWSNETGAGGSISAEAVEAYNQIHKHLAHFVDEIESCIRYYSSLARGAGIDRIVFLGPGARDRALVQVIGSYLSVPCEVGAPLQAASQAAAGGEAAPELAVALGLSLFGAQ